LYFPKIIHFDTQRNTAETKRISRIDAFQGLPGKTTPALARLGPDRPQSRYAKAIYSSGGFNETGVLSRM
jgi:hypothetical protein